MPLKERFVDRDILDTHDPSIRVELANAVDQQKRIPVGKDRLNLNAVHH
jgi:hypothetical protein